MLFFEQMLEVSREPDASGGGAGIFSTKYDEPIILAVFAQICLDLLRAYQVSPADAPLPKLRSIFHIIFRKIKSF